MWRVLTDHGPVFWTESNQDWPCGHAGKLYGAIGQNNPLWVHIAPDASACLSVYEHDVLVTPGLPLRWRNVGDFAVGERARGEPSVLIFQRSEADDAYPGDPSVGDADARDRFARVTLGPSEHARYVVGFAAPTWRVRGKSGERLASADSGWIVYDAQHQPVHSGTGDLLAGWDRWGIIHEHGHLRREDLSGGTAELLGDASRDIAGAVAIAGTPNAVLLSLVGNEAWLRVV